MGMRGAMHISKGRTPARPTPYRVCCPGAAPCIAEYSFTFGGHRLSSLYRRNQIATKTFIFAKILKKLWVPRGASFEYLDKDEAREALI